MGKQVRRWLPDRQITIVADSSYVALDLLSSLETLYQPVHMVTQLRLDAGQALIDVASDSGRCAHSQAPSLRR